MYTPLYIKTNNSLLSSMIRIDELVDYAVEHHISSLSITDDRMYGVMEFYKACVAHQIKPLIGLEIKLDGCFILYCKNEVGYRNLIKLSTLQSEGKISLDSLSDLSCDLICIVPFSSRHLYETLNKIYIDIFQGYTDLEERNSLEGDNLVYCQETLYLRPEEESYLGYLWGIRDGVTIDKVYVFHHHQYLVDESVIRKHFPDDIKNNEKITEMCHVKLEHNPNLLPIFPCPDGMDSFRYLKELCKAGLKRIFGDRVGRVYIERLKYELDVIQKMGFCDYFLVVADFVNYAKEHDILIGPGRGSAAGSLVSYCLNITTIDPIRYQLFFERFLNPERITMPDIDIDMEDTKRQEVIDYCIQKYGMKRVVPIIAFGTLGCKQAIRDVGRVMDIDLKVIDTLCKMLDSKLSLHENYQGNLKLQQYVQASEELKKLYDIALHFEGLKRHTTIHAAGVVMSNVDIDTVIPLDKNHDDFYTTAYSMNYLEELGLLKMDFLAIRTLSIIHNIIRDIGNGLTFDSIPEQDKETLSIFTNVNTLGIFQFESSGMMSFLRKFRPTTFEDIFAAIALYRPGPMHNIDSYIKRKHGKEAIDYLDESLISILKPTYGIIIYQEQIMQIANVMASYSLGEADVLRRAMSKKKEDVLLNEKEKFIRRSVQNGYREEVALKVYELILKFASYGFNRSHSVAYAFVAYRMAYLKAHYPKVFMKNLLSMFMGSESKMKDYIYECKLNHIDILKPDINYSVSEYCIEEKGIRFPFTGIRGIGELVSHAIIQEREKGLFLDIYDFFARCYKYLNRKIVENLVYAGCFDSLQIERKVILENMDVLINYSDLASYLDEEYALKPELVYYAEFSRKELMQQELSVFGFYLSKHPVTEYRLKYPDTVAASEMERYFDKVITTIVFIEKIKEVKTKNQDTMLFVTGSDEIQAIDIVLFPKVYERYRDIMEGSVLKIVGKVEKRFDKYQLVLSSLEVLD